MSREGRSARGGGREGLGSLAPQPYPTHFYPMVGYQGPPQPWFPGHPATGVPTPWAPSWSPPMGYPAPTPPWSTQQTASTATTTSSTAPIPSDEYTVDTLRRVYKDDDGRVEIQRVKVQRRHPETGALALPTGPEAMSVVPVGNVSVNERRPPPRKNRRKQQMQMVTPGPGQAPGPYPWYPYMPCMPYPYPYPYYFGGCMWPPGVPAASVASWSGNDESERASSRQDSLPATLDSQRLESRISPPSHVTHRTPSPAAASHVTDTHSIAPSDSVSVRGRKRETSLERALRGPTPPPRTKSRASTEFKSSDVGKTQEWILEMHQALGTAPGDVASDLTDKSSVTSAPSDVVVYKKIPPMRKRRKVKMGSISDKDSVIDQKDIDNISDRQSVVSDVTFDESSRLSSELNYAFRKLERSVDAFKTEVSVESTPVQSPAPSPSIDFIHSSGNATPTGEDMIGPSLSDISLPLEETSKHIIDEQDQIEASCRAIDRAISPCSVSSLPSLVTGKTGSVADVSSAQVVMDAPPAEAPHSVPDSSAKPQMETNPSHPTASDAVSASNPAVPEASSSHPKSSVTPTSQALSGRSTTHITADAAPQQANDMTSMSVSTPVRVTSASAPTSDLIAQAVPSSGETAQLAPQSETVSSQPMTVLPSSQPVTESIPSAGQPVPVLGSAGQPVPVSASPGEPVPVSASQPVSLSAGQPVSASLPVPLSAGQPVSADQPVPVSASQPASVSAGQPVSADQPVPVPVPTGQPMSAGQSASREAAGGVGQVEALDDASGRDSRASSSTFFSARPSDDPMIVDTDSTDILLPTTADEGGDQTDSTAVSSGPDEGYQWVLQQPGETPDLAASNAAGGEDDRRNAWRAEVSLWRARLVVSLCRGRGLDRQDWATFHLLVHHPLTLDLKLSLLHAQRFCAANKAAGAALVRVGLIHLAQYGEMLLQPEESRQSTWRAIKVDPSQPWAPVKGAMEILRSLGYREREDGGILKFPRRSGPEVSVLARLTLDMLVLAEELRLYLTGTHQYPANISDLFFPVSVATTAPSDLPQTPSSSAGSFVSAHPEAPPDLRPASRASSVTDDDTETLQASVRQVKTHKKKAQRSSSSEEEITLKDDIANIVPAKVQAAEIALDVQETVLLPSTPDTLPISKEVQQLGSTVSLPTTPGDRSSVSTNMTSLPDLQSIRSSSSSQQSHSHTGSAASGSTDTVTPVVTPAPVPTASSDNPEEHIYEEIDVIRAQTQAVRASSVPIESAPPPLPPKKKVSSGGEDDSGLSLTYPQVEWTSASTPGSLRGGSTGARRKKRRAPMPPEFMPPDWKYNRNKSEESPEQTTETQDVKEDEKKRAEYLRSLNPFYEETPAVQGKAEELNDTSVKSKDESVNKTAHCNPFTVDTVKVAGYVGKNPFYEDVEILQKTKDSKETSASHPSLSSLKLEGSVCAMGSLSELQDNSVVVRPKRRAPKPPPTPQLTTHPSTPELPKHPATQQKTEPPEKPKRPPTPEILKQASVTSPSTLPKDKTSHTEKVNVKQEVVANDTTVPMDTKTIPQIQNKIDMMDASHTSSQAAANPAENDSKVTPTVGDEKTVAALRKDEVTACPNSTYESGIQSDDLEKGMKTQTSNPPSSDQKDLDVENHQLKNLQPEQDGQKSPETSADDKNKKKESTVPPVTKDDDKFSKTEELRQTTPKISRAAQQRMSPQHPKTPPPPPPKAEVGVAKETPVSTPTAETPPPVLPPKAPLSILDDIPYMDANEIKYAKAKFAMQKLPQSHRNEIPEAPGNTSFDVAPSESLPTMSQSASLLRGTHIASITDESDLPPDCPPPPPPGPPPESPPTSPPETPHTSPPETPHTSPPETPRSSPRSSPITVTPFVPATTTDTKSRQDADAIITKGNEGAVKDVAPPIPPKTTQLMLALVETPQSVSTTALSTSGQPVAAQPKLSTSPDTVQPPPVLPPKATLKTATPAPPETSASDNHEPASGKHSLQSSVSEERYEIPDTSLAPPPRPPPPTKPPSKQQTKDQTTEPYTAPSEADRYEVPEPPKEAFTTPKAAEVEERYEIPEVVKAKALKSGANGAPLTVVMGRTASLKRRELEAVFGPPKPPRRRRSHPPPPPRPPKSVTLMDGTRSLTKARTAARPPSATSSFSSTSGGTSSSVPTAPPPSQSKQKNSRLRRSWPFLFCDCMYVNCRTYDDVNKK